MPFHVVLLILVLLQATPSVPLAGAQNESERTTTPVLAARPEDVPVLLKEAQGGNKTAQLSLGLSYLNGSGVAQNPSEAAKWFQSAAEQGVSMAQVLLGKMLIDGVGANQDKAAGVRWLRTAAEQ